MSDTPVSQPPPPAGPPLSTAPPGSLPPPASAAGPGAAGWSPRDVVLGIVMLLAIAFVGGIIVFAIAGDSGLDATIGAQLVLEAGFLGSAVYFARRHHGTRDGLLALGLGAPRRPWAGATALAFFGYLAFALVYTQLVAQPEQTNVAEDLGFDSSTAGAISAAILIVLLAPLAEETFFRGFVFGGLRGAMPSAAAIAISGAIFGSVHLTTGNVASAVQLAVLGAILAWLYEHTGSIRPTILVHVINNGIAFAVLVGG